MNLAVKKINQWTDKKGLSQKDFAALLGKSQPYISMVCSGRIVVPDSMKQKFNEVTNGHIKLADWFKEAE